MIICNNLLAYLVKPSRVHLFQAPLLRFKPGGRYAIMGPSGCGKSVLTKYLAGLLPDQENQILFDVGNFKSPRTMLYLPQDSRDSVRPWLNTRDIFRNASLDILDILGLRENFNKRQYPRNMSGGELRRLALGDLLIKGERDALILDEPLNGLDENLRGRCTEAINHFMKKYPQTCLIFVTHYRQEVDELRASEIRCISINGTKEFVHV